MTIVNFKKQLDKLGLNSSNSIIMGSGILQAKGVRNSNDIDLIVPKDIFISLKNTPELVFESRDDGDRLTNSSVEIFTQWNVLGEEKYHADLLKDTVVIDNLRYLSLDLTTALKKANGRPKDLLDLELINTFINKHYY